MLGSLRAETVTGIYWAVEVAVVVVASVVQNFL
jgi:hypothetical protein